MLRLRSDVPGTARVMRAVLLLLLLSPSVRLCAQVAEPEPLEISKSEWKGGYNGFAMLCRLTGATVHSSVSEWSAVPPSRSLMIVLGDAWRLPVDPLQYVEQGGAVLIASDHKSLGLYALDWGIVFRRGPVYARRSWDGYRGLTDCPVVRPTPFGDNPHPTQQGWRRIATNRPGYLRQLGNFDNVRPIAVLPEVHGLSEPGVFAAVMQQDDQPQGVFVADPSIFTNQMLMCEDNAVFAQQSLLWLCQERRRDILIVSDQVVASPLEPDEVILPPPDPKDVMEAMKRLPPEALLEFGNLVATAAEDEGIIDELLVDVAEAVPYRAVMRVLLVTASIILGLWLIYRLFNRRTDRQHASLAKRRSPQVQASIERRQAAIVLLDQLRSDISSGSTLGWNEVLSAVDGSSAVVRKFRQHVKKTLQQIYRQSLGAWSQRRLRTLEREIEGWRLLHSRGELRCDL